MKPIKKISSWVVSIIFCCFCILVVRVEAILPPVLTVDISGYNVTLSWNKVADATGYILSYAPFPDASYIGTIDMEDQTDLTVQLWDGAAFWVAVQAYDFKNFLSDYSNLHLATIVLHRDDVDEDCLFLCMSGCIIGESIIPEMPPTFEQCRIECENICGKKPYLIITKKWHQIIQSRNSKTTIDAQAEIYLTLNHITGDFYHVQFVSPRYAYWNQITVKNDGTIEKCNGSGADINKESIIGTTIVVPKDLSSNNSLHLPPIQVDIPTNCGIMPHLGGIQFPVIQAIGSKIESYSGKDFKNRQYLRELWEYEYIGDDTYAKWNYGWNFISGLE